MTLPPPNDRPLHRRPGPRPTRPPPGRAARVAAAAACLVAGACAPVPRVAAPPGPPAAGPAPAADRINWPPQYEPAGASFFVSNEVHVAAPPEAVWRELVRAESWPTWYEGASGVKVPGAADGELAGASVFTWETMGLDFTSRVTEFRPPYRLSWESRKASIQGYHAWLIVPTAKGCKVVTQESQHGFLTYMQKVFVPNKLHRLHDVWLAKLKARAEASAAAAGGKS